VDVFLKHGVDTFWLWERNRNECRGCGDESNKHRLNDGKSDCGRQVASRSVDDASPRLPDLAN